MDSTPRNPDSLPSLSSQRIPDSPSAPSEPSTSSNPALNPSNPALVAFASRIYSAARSGDLPLFQQALPAGLPPNLTNEKGDTILMLACYHGHAPVAHLLLEHGADPNKCNDRGQSPLAGAVFKHEKEVVETLLEFDADPDVGQPSAEEAVGIFRLEGDWGAKFEEVRQRVRRKRGGEVEGEGITARDEDSKGRSAAVELA